MKELIKDANRNYSNIKIRQICEVPEKTINTIFIINNSYILKMYNVDNENQIKNSIITQKMVHDKISLAPNIILNNKNELYTVYKDCIYCIQEKIHEEELNANIVEIVAKNLAKMHLMFENLDSSTYKIKKDNKNYEEIFESIKNTKIKDIDNTIENAVNHLLNKRLELLNKYKCSYSPEIFQIIHGDVRLSNIIKQRENAFFIDFDFVSFSDLLYEIGSSAMLISNFNIKEAKRFIEIYNKSAKKNIKEKDIMNNLISYYIQSSFPLRLIGRIESKQVEKMMNDRIRALEFCDKYFN